MSRLRSTYPLRDSLVSAKLYPTIGLILLFGVLLASGCHTPEKTSGSIVIDETGRSVSLPATISRVVTLAPSITELVLAAGGSSYLIAVSTADNLSETESLDKINAVPVDYEAVVALSPDLVLLLDGVNKRSDADRLEQLGIVAYMIKSESLDDVIDDIALVGELLGLGESASNHARLLKLAAASISTAATSISDKPSVLFLVGDETLYSFGAGSYINDIIQRAGGVSVTDSVDQLYPVLSEEFVLTSDPDFIVGAFGEDYDKTRLLKLHPAWSGLRAYSTGRIISLDPDIILRPGPRLVNALTILADKLHPELSESNNGIVVVE